MEVHDPYTLQTSNEDATVMLLGLRKLRDERRMCDITLNSDDGSSFVAHSVVLAAASEVLGAMMNESFREGQSRTLALKVSGRALHITLDYIYGKDVRLSRQELADVLHLAHLYELTALEHKVNSAILHSLDAKLALRLLVENEALLGIDLEEACQLHLATHFDDCVQLGEFVNLPPSQLSSLMNHPRLAVSREETVVEALFKWYHAAAPRENNLHSVMCLLFKGIRFGLLAEDSLRSIEKLAQSLGPCGVQLQKDVRKGLRVHGRSGGLTDEPSLKRLCMQHWWAGFGASISGGISVAEPLKARTIAMDGRDFIVCQCCTNSVLRWRPLASEGVVIAGEGAPINGPNDLGKHIHAFPEATGTGILIADFHNNRVLKVVDGRSELVGEGWDGPVAVCSTRSHGIFVLDRLGNRVQKLSEQRVDIVAQTEGNKPCMGGLCATEQGTIFLIHTKRQQVLRFEPGSAKGAVVVDGAANDLEIEGIWVSPDGVLYIADGKADRVLRWSMDAASGITIAGGNGQGSGAHQLSRPLCVTGDAAGAIYVGEKNASRISQWGPPQSLRHVMGN